MDVQLKKGIIEMCILKSIADKGSIYAILRRLNLEGYTETYKGRESGGPTRKYYRITEGGRKYLATKIKEWNMIHRIVEDFGLNGESEQS